MLLRVGNFYLQFRRVIEEGSSMIDLQRKEINGHLHALEKSGIEADLTNLPIFGK
jgi:hypothetical protein